jgi:nucleotide-binding universal stress UspA family protein
MGISKSVRKVPVSPAHCPDLLNIQINLDVGDVSEFALRSSSAHVQLGTKVPSVQPGRHFSGLPPGSNVGGNGMDIEQICHCRQNGVIKMPGIIVGVDGSGRSQRALEWAMNEAAIRHSPLTVFVVQQPVVGCGGRGVPFANYAELASQAGDEAKRETDEVLAKLGGNRPESISVELRSGMPAGELLGAAKDAEMIVLGSRGAGGFAKLVMGSVSAQATHHAHCPVVIIPPEDMN